MFLNHETDVKSAVSILENGFHVYRKEPCAADRFANFFIEGLSTPSPSHCGCIMTFCWRGAVITDSDDICFADAQPNTLYLQGWRAIIKPEAKTDLVFIGAQLEEDAASEFPLTLLERLTFRDPTKVARARIDAAIGKIVPVLLF